MKHVLPLILLIAIAAPAFSQKTRTADNDHLTRTKSFAVTPGGLLNVDVNGGEIHIMTSGKNEVVVTARADDEEAFDELRISAAANTVAVDNSSNIWSAGDSRYEISVPREFNIKIKTTNGDIIITGALRGYVHTITDAGDIRLGDVAGDVDVNTSGGNITTGSVDGDVKVQTSGGDIRLGLVSGRADITTSGGNIQVDNVKNVLHARTSGGDIIIGDVGGEATVSTSGGNVTVGKVSGNAKLSTAGGDIELDGASGIVKANTAGGNIRLREISGAIEAKTAGGDIHADLLPGGASNSKLTTASGMILLSIPENAKATVNARIKVWGYGRIARSGYAVHSAFPAKTYDTDDEDHVIVGSYVLNGGGDTITLETVNADIEIRKLERRSK
jgi:hypothetical protein